MNKDDKAIFGTAAGLWIVSKVCVAIAWLVMIYLAFTSDIGIVAVFFWLLSDGFEWMSKKVAKAHEGQADGPNGQTA